MTALVKKWQSHPWLPVLLQWWLRARAAVPWPRWVTAVILAYLAGCAVFPMIGQRLLNRSQMTVVRAAIVAPTAKQLRLKLWARLAETGPLAAVVKFLRPAVVRNHRDEAMALAELQGALAVPAHGGFSEFDVVLTPGSGAGDVSTQRFAEFATALIQSDGNVTSSLAAPSVAVRALGVVSIPHLTLNKQLSLQGLGGLSDLSVTGCRVVGGTPEYLVLLVDCLLVNPSNVSLMELGDCYFSLAYDPLYVKQHPWLAPAAQFADDYSVGGAAAPAFATASSSQELPAVPAGSDAWEPLPEHVGILPGSLATVCVRHMSLREGANALRGVCYFAIPDATAEPDGAAHALEILSAFMRGDATPGCVLSGHYHHAIAAEYLLPSMRSLHMHTTLPGIPTAASHPMIRSAALRLSLSAITSVLTSLAAPTLLDLYNPLDTDVTILRITSVIRYQGAVIGELDVPFGPAHLHDAETPSEAPAARASTAPPAQTPLAALRSARAPSSAASPPARPVSPAKSAAGNPPPILLPAKRSVTTPLLPMGVKMSVRGLSALVEATGGLFNVDADSVLDVVVGSANLQLPAQSSRGRSVSHGGYRISSLRYSQRDIPVTLSLG